MRLNWFLFAVLAGTHATAVLVAPERLAPALAGSVYLPLLPLKAVGIPVFATAESGGWASPSLLGWATVFLLVWYLVGGSISTFTSVV